MNVEIVPKSQKQYEKMAEARSRVSVPATFVSYKRSQRRVYVRYALLRIENVATRAQAERYVGNAVEMYIPKEKVQASGYKERVVKGYIHRVHGDSGVVRARFVKNLSPGFLGTKVSVKLYKAGMSLFAH